MFFDYAYRGNSSVESSANATAMSFVPDAKREPTYFSGELRQKIEFREATGRKSPRGKAKRRRKFAVCRRN
jgi:hypothetical protein